MLHPYLDRTLPKEAVQWQGHIPTPAIGTSVAGCLVER